MYCSGVTKQNTPCLRKCKGTYCSVHKNIKYNECMICYEDSTCEVVLECGHSMCMNCSYKCDIRCPMCRQVTNKSKLEAHKLNENLANKMTNAMTKEKPERIKLMYEMFDYTMKNHQYFLSFPSMRNSVKEKLIQFKNYDFNSDKYLKQIEAYEQKLE